MSMTKADIADHLYENIGGFSKKQAMDYVDVVFDMVKNTLASGQEVKISRFGKFSLRDKKDRKGRNPQTGEEIVISKRRVVTFSVSAYLRDAVNLSPQ